MARTVHPESHARRRAAIVAAAAEEFAAHGIDGTSTAAICRRAGIGSGTLFHYFKTKPEIFHAVFADDLPLVTRLCEQALAEPDPDTGLDVLIDHLISEISHPLAPGLASAAALQANRDPDFARLLVTMDEQMLRTIATILRRVEAKPGRTLAFPSRSTARWIQNLVDASHLGIIEGPRARTVQELRRVVAWLVGRNS
jgi:AcrR family transcriptional regulator